MSAETVARLADLLLVAIIALDVYLTSTSRLGARVRACALQGVVHGVLPFAVSGAVLAQVPGGMIHLVLATVGTLALKAVVIPFFMLRAVRESGTRREVEPYVSLHLSLLIAVALVGVSFALAAAFGPALGRAAVPSLALPAGLSTLLIGMFLTINGKTELTQIIGYQVLQNGVFVLGQTLVGESPLLVELGVLLDVLVAVMLTGLFVVQLAAPSALTAHADVDSEEEPS
jgi:hydrogenase-4 component E